VTDFDKLETRTHAFYVNRNGVVFEPGNWVRYVPTHAWGNVHHPDCQDGVVKRYSNDGKTVFVLYDNEACKMMTGNEPYTAQGTDRDDLVYIGRRRR